MRARGHHLTLRYEAEAEDEVLTSKSGGVGFVEKAAAAAAAVVAAVAVTVVAAVAVTVAAAAVDV